MQGALGKFHGNPSSSLVFAKELQTARNRKKARENPLPSY